MTCVILIAESFYLIKHPTINHNFLSLKCKMSSFCYNVFGIFLLVALSHQVPQIFQEKSTCEISVEIKRKSINYVVPAHVMAQNKDLRVEITLCNENIYLPGGQSTFSTVHLYNKTSKMSLHDSIAPKPYQASHTKEGILISLENEIQCNEEEKYSFFIQMGEFNSKIPRLNLETECVIGIEMASPDHNPPCMQHIEGKWFIDMSPLRFKPPITINKGGKTFKISMCGPIRQCKQEVGCKLEGNETTIFGALDKLGVKFDETTNALSVVSSVAKPKNTMTLRVKCNWNVPKFSNPKLLNEGTNYKFEVQSSYGCVKMPKSCRLTEESKHLTYDLTGLTPSTGLTVRNTSRHIVLSICEDLKMAGSDKNDCRLEKSQVCEIRNGYINRGSIPQFQVHESGITASFRDGHECNENKTFSTTIDFECSSADTGPVFVSEEGCLTKLSWKTPRACPKLQINQKSCLLYSKYGSLNLTELHSSDDYTTRISPSQKLVYNVCGKLQTKCSESEEVSACLIDGGQEKIVGWNEPTLSFVNGKIELKYSGEKCERHQKPYTLTINPICSFREGKTVDPQVSRVDECTFEAKIPTRSACLKSWETKNCTLDTDNYRYDLSPLIGRDQSYQIADPRNPDITYFLNLCAPVIPKEDMLLYSNRMVYMRNSSVPSILKRFTDLGVVANPEVRDGKLVVEAKGETCVGDKVYRSTIFFECSDQEGQPTLLKRDECHVDFTWKTKFACLIMKKGGTCSFVAGNVSTQAPGDPIEVSIDNVNTYQFSLCLDQYRWCRRDGYCLTGELSRNVRIQNGIIHVQYRLQQFGGSQLKTVSLVVECDPYKWHDFSKRYGGGDRLDIYVKTRMSCQNGNKTTRDVEKPESNTEVGKEKEKKHVEQTDIKEKNKDQNLGERTTQKSNTSHPSETKKRIVETTSSSDFAKRKVNEDKSDKKKDTTSHPSEEKTEIVKYKSSVPVVNLDDRTHKSTNDSKKADFVEPPPNPCNVLHVKGRTVNLTDLDSKEFKVSNDIYIVNFDGSSSKCKGRICKNGGSILDFIEKCPEVSYEDDNVVLKYSTGGSCLANLSASADEIIVEVSLGCDEEIVARGSEQNCKVTVSYNSPKICFSSESSNSFITISVVIVLFVSFVICLTIFILKKNDFFKKCSYDKVSEECLVVHSKML